MNIRVPGTTTEAESSRNRTVSYTHLDVYKRQVCIHGSVCMHIRGCISYTTTVCTLAVVNTKVRKALVYFLSNSLRQQTHENSKQYFSFMSVVINISGTIFTVCIIFVFEM